MAVQISGNDITVPRDGTFTRNVTIGGTLTYEDVTNIDSVGLVTARTGIEIGARPGVAASISVDGNMIVSGISTFGGDIQVPDKIIHSGDTDTAIRFSGADTITAETGGSSRFKIDSSGNVTIGNDGDSGSNPSSGYDELCIEGGNEAIGMCFLSPAANNVEQTIAFGDSNNNQSGKIQYEHANDAMHFDTAGSERVRIASDGKVHIGLTNGAGQFNVKNQDDTATNALEVYNDNGVRVSGFSQSSSGDATMDLRTNAPLQTVLLRSNGASYLNGGNVGINEAAPSEKLQIDGDILLGGQANSGTSDYAIKFEYNNHQFAKIVGDGRDSSGYGDLDFYTSSGSGVSNLTQRMTVRANGNVGINVDDPDQRLEVDGIIKGSSYFQAGASGTATNNFHFGAEGNGEFRIYSGNYGAGNQKFKIDSSGNAIFGDVSAPYSSDSVTIHPADGMVNFGMDGRSSLITGQNSCYIFSGSGASGDMPAGSLVLQSRANENRNIFFATGSTPSIKWQIHGSSGALRSYNYLPAGGYSTSTANGYDIYLKLQGQVPTGTAGNAYTLFMTNAVSDAGAYILVIRSFEQSVTGGNLWSVRMVTSPFYVHYGSGNDGESVTIPYTYSGHANNATTQSQNGDGPVTLRSAFYNGSAHTHGKITITFNGFNYTGSNCDYYVYKLIDV